MSIEIAQYAAAVGAALADLPENTRNELLEDLPAHLAEVAEEVEADGGSLEDRLGPPAAYAAELRATLGVEGARRGSSLAAATAKARARLRSFDTKAGKPIGYASLSEFGSLLRPAWWIVRGYLAAWALAAIVNTGDTGLIPRLGDTDVLGGLLLTVAAIIASIWLGKTAAGRRRTWQRVLSGVATAGLAIFGLAVFVTADDELAGNSSYMETPSSYVDVYYAQGHNGDVVVVDAQGRIIGPVSIIDLNSENYLNAKIHTCDSVLAWEYERWPLLAQLCGRANTGKLLPRTEPSENQPSPSPSVSGPPAPPSPAPTVTPSR